MAKAVVLALAALLILAGCSGEKPKEQGKEQVTADAGGDAAGVPVQGQQGTGIAAGETDEVTSLDEGISGLDDSLEDLQVTDQDFLGVDDNTFT